MLESRYVAAERKSISVYYSFKGITGNDMVDCGTFVENHDSINNNWDSVILKDLTIFDKEGNFLGQKDE